MSAKVCSSSFIPAVIGIFEKINCWNALTDFFEKIYFSSIFIYQAKP